MSHLEVACKALDRARESLQDAFEELSAKHPAERLAGCAIELQSAYTGDGYLVVWEYGAHVESLGIYPHGRLAIYRRRPWDCVVDFFGDDADAVILRARAWLDAGRSLPEAWFTGEDAGAP